MRKDNESLEAKRSKSYTNLEVNIDASEFKIEHEKCSDYMYRSIPLVFKSLYLKLEDHLLLGGEHDKKISPGFLTPQSISNINLTSEEKKEIVLSDPKFGMFSLFKYHFNKGYLNNELKKTNKVYCSHIFSLVFALPLLIFISQWFLYGALLSHEIKKFNGNFCPNDASLENKLIMAGTGLLYFVRSFFIWDNLTTRIGLIKTNRVNSISAMLDTFQEFLFNIIVYGANIWIIFVEDDIQNMILNSLAMEFLMQLDNEFEELYFRHLPGSAEDIYDNIYVTYRENKELVKNRYKYNICFRAISNIIYIPYKILVLIIFIFPAICFFMTIAGSICK
tara:strand:- start:2383 stop:3387 length:1005 start_codon:yes stop_codon:yes gene_type:complete